ncbi:hypothetical protein [Oerskovia turbata]|uniref:hypothetical protein n=1 Tax=Oerskovia turbata TaxID=1713 RepID=UPI0004C23F11|nr:hypothetical protein [Oerskovia turbata]
MPVLHLYSARASWADATPAPGAPVVPALAQHELRTGEGRHHQVAVSARPRGLARADGTPAAPARLTT